MANIAIQDLAATLVPAPWPRVGLGSISIGAERPGDAAAREALLDRAFGPARFAKTCERLRAGRRPALALVARSAGVLVGTVRLWHVDAGGVAALMLGPLAVDAQRRGLGIGAQLMSAALARAAALGHRAVLLVGDAPFYGRFGFERRHALALALPGPVESDRFLALELVPDALTKADGPVKATGMAARRAVLRLDTPGDLCPAA